VKAVKNVPVGPGDYRIVYSVNDEKKVHKVLPIAHRKEVYR
jgi:mRNA-degrading endonuclease RelE of RelBE toxin-antitoxin system